MVCSCNSESVFRGLYYYNDRTSINQNDILIHKRLAKLKPTLHCKNVYQRHLRYRWPSILLFICIATLTSQCINASETKLNTNEPLPDINEVFSATRTARGNKRVKKEVAASLYENIAHAFSEQEVIIPIRLNHRTGKPVHHGHHFRSKRQLQAFGGENRHRSRRNAGHFADLDSAVPEHSVANFSITAFGEEFRLHLTSYSEFIAPTFTLQYTANVTSKINADIEDVPRHCFYSGTVNSNPAHTVVISVCGGMFGAFRTHDMDYLIQPHDLTKFSKIDSLNFEDEVGTKPHKIFRRSTRKSAHKSKQLCAFQENSDQKMNSKDTDGNTSNNTENVVKSNSNRHDHTASFDEYLSQHIENMRDDIKTFKTNMNKKRPDVMKGHESYKLNSRISQNIHKEKHRKLHRALRFRNSKIQSEKQQDESIRDEVKSRQKRYLSYPRNVEVMVTADNGMVKTHGANLQHYVLTLMAIVHHVYLDASIGNYINIVLVKLVVIGDDDIKSGPKITKNAHDCLRNFCRWQADENDLDDSHPNHYDTAVLITRQDICRTETACDTLGLAELGTMCDPLRSCSINEDNGLSTAFTIAHEIGHEFNAPHDNNEKCLSSSSGRDTGMHVMSPTLDHKSKPWSWSKCSARFITSFLDYGNGQCLLDDPPQRVLPLPREEPGQMYDVNQQCSFVYGKGVTHCGFMTTCVRLWCVSADRRHGCRTPHMPWADGTRCAPGMWCQKGKCVTEDRHKRPVDGEWGEWSKFGVCSRTCGGGIRIAQRECNKPTPKDGGHYCVGKRKKFRSCNWQECKVARDFRAEQCSTYSWSKYNRHQIRGVSVDAKWIPKYDGILLQDRCKLICQVKKPDQYGAPFYVLKPKVINGTPCGPYTSDICVEGICKRAGCDHVLNSNTREDECGVCGGDNSGCRTVKGVYNVGKLEGYNIVVEIPNGATNIVIEQRSFGIRTEDNNFLALKDASGKFVLNGNRNVVQFEHHIQKRSPTGRGYSYQFDYTGTDNIVERINSTKAIRENITVLILSAGDLLPPNIKYRYNIPLPEQIIYAWDPYGPWSFCSSSCQGRTKRKVLCKRSSDGQIVADHKCHARNKPSTIIRPCNSHCEIKWQTRSSECSVRCGQGIATHTYNCIKITTLSNGKLPTIEILRESECTSPKPRSVSNCKGECLPTSWHYGNWSKCTKDCGGGSQTRSSECRDSKGVVLSPNDCNIKTRLTSRMCNHFACPQWVTSDFSQCLKTCGTGVRHRRVWCRGSSGKTQSDSVCDIRSKPPGTVRCTLAPCPTWKYEDWGKCSVTCGTGVTMRGMRCTDFLGRHVGDEQCDAGRAKKDTKACFEAECIISAYVRPPISHDLPLLINRGTLYDDPPPQLSDEVPFGRSLQISRKVEDDRNSIQPRTINIFTEKKENVIKLIGSNLNIAQWRTGHWTECSKTCGSGHRERYVSCRHNNGHEVTDDYCTETKRPVDKEECDLEICYGKWRFGAWSECSSSCGPGRKTRYVHCMLAGRYSREDRCNLIEKPLTEQQCLPFVPCTTTNSMLIEKHSTIPSAFPPNHTALIVSDQVLLEAAGKWRIGPWSQCSSSCGSGNQKRAVECLGRCDAIPMPSVIQLCDSGFCPTWQQGEWSKCSVTCGSGISTRTVECAMPDGSVTTDAICEIMKRPSDAMPCGVGRCPGRSYRWKSTHWSGCSVTCGRGMKQREVTCVDAAKSIVSDDMCSGIRSRKPTSVRRCRTRRRCPRWHAGDLNTCSVTCGAGIRTRSVYCRYKRKRLAEDYCDHKTKPDNAVKCFAKSCISYQWKTSEWSLCSKKCGEGTTTRFVTCVNNRNSTFSDMHCDVKTRPPTQQLCSNGPCSSYWETDRWSKCSSTCGEGIQHRTVRCAYSESLNHEVLPATNCDPMTKPYDVQPCNSIPCDVIWRVGPWSECSSTCGEGIIERRVVCFSRITNQILPDYTCGTESIPDKSTRCRRAPCMPTSCRHAQLILNKRTDGHYTLQIRGQPVTIYCKDMNTRHPTEFITLSGENFSEIYSFSLNDSGACPNNGSRNDHCACTKNPQSGKTIFQKIRFDIRSMKVIVSDFTFSKNVYGRLVGFGVAGDCYSTATCPQGEFRINLTDTKFSVSSSTKWNSYGRHTSQRIFHDDNGKSIIGKCGGYCGQCRPDPLKGLILTLTSKR